MNPSVLVEYSFRRLVTLTAVPSGTSWSTRPDLPNSRRSQPGWSGGRTPYILVSSHVASKGNKKMSTWVLRDQHKRSIGLNRKGTDDGDDEEGEHGGIAVRRSAEDIGSEWYVLV